MINELTTRQKEFIRSRNLIKNGWFVYCVKETAKRLDGTEIELETLKCKVEDGDKGEAKIFHKLDGIFPDGYGAEIDAMVWNKDWIHFVTKKAYKEDIYCGVAEDGSFTNGKEVFYEGKGGTIKFKRFLFCGLLKGWMEED